MRRMLMVCMMAGLMAAASPVAGTWEGVKDGVKAATLKVQETDGILGGSVIFYITRDEGRERTTVRQCLRWRSPARNGTLVCCAFR